MASDDSYEASDALSITQKTLQVLRFLTLVVHFISLQIEIGYKITLQLKVGEYYLGIINHVKSWGWD